MPAIPATLNGTLSDFQNAFSLLRVLLNQGTTAEISQELGCAHVNITYQNLFPQIFD